jgi:hypothetical protein
MANQEIYRDSSADIPIANLLHGKIDEESGQIISKIICENYNKRRSLCKELIELENPHNPDTKAIDSDTKLKIEKDIRNSIFKINKFLYCTIEQMKVELMRKRYLNSDNQDSTISHIEAKVNASQLFINQRIEFAALVREKKIIPISKEPGKQVSKESRLESNIKDVKLQAPAISNQDLLISVLALYDLERYENIIEIIMNHYAKITNPLSTPNPEEY